MVHVDSAGSEHVRGVWLLLVLLVVSGCDRALTPMEQARDYVAGWPELSASMGSLPNDQVPFFAEHYDQVEPILGAALSDTDPDSRRAAAYMVEELGPRAKGMAPTLVQRVEVEQDPAIRIYLYGALASVGASSPETLRSLRERFNALEHREAATDERIYLTAALFNLESEDMRSRYADELLRWLEPIPSELDDPARERHWEHRWHAVTAVTSTPDLHTAVPLLRQMLRESDRKPWVDVKVNRALTAIGNPSSAHTP